MTKASAVDINEIDLDAMDDDEEEIVMKVAADADEIDLDDLDEDEGDVAVKASDVKTATVDDNEIDLDDM